MLKTVHAISNKDGTYRLAEPVELKDRQHVLVTLVESEEDEEFVGGVPATMLLAEPALREYWDAPEEDEAWKDFQDEAK